MNTTTTFGSLAGECRDALTQFWGEQLRFETTRNGVVMALPLMYPDGLQVVLTLNPVASGSAILSDGGHTLGQLSTSGLNFDAHAKQTHSLLNQRLQAFELERDGLELRKAIKLPVDGLDIQLFGEALVSIAHLIYRYDAEGTVQSAADRTVRKVFADRQIQPQQPHYLAGRIEKRIKVDFFWSGKRPLAVEVIRRRGANLAYMEQWAWRWTDLHNRDESLLRAMIYDPDLQSFDETTVEIAKSVCELFCPYFETDSLHRLIESAG